jgi:thiosulfate/3-mercaptopyruvate sulfurtransferase
MNRYNGRVWWVLKYLGASDVSVLHFNLEQITAAKIGLTAVPNILKTVTFTPTIHPEMVCKMAEIQKAERNFLLLDGRDKEEFDGVDAAKRSKGHLPGAVLLSFKDLQTTTGAYKSKEEIVEIAAKSGANPDKSMVVYCNTGIKASVLYIALKEIAGFTNVRYYDGSYAEWVSVPENKLIK